MKKEYNRLGIEERSLRISAILKAPIEQVWKVWTEPDHIAKWWGPKGFTNTIHVMHLHKDGEWRLTMHGPDGTNFANRSVFREIVPFEKIVFDHFNPNFLTTVRFESNDGNTLMEWTAEFESVELFDIVVKAHKADVGMKQNVEKLEAYLKTLQK
ncbi:MAG: SRPBCC domain-containing protein [Flavobacteriaceae bacterium]|nr:SRPBCC domain-containing protein [Flavobacteriaceae bacterium]